MNNFTKDDVIEHAEATKLRERERIIRIIKEAERCSTPSLIINGFVEHILKEIENEKR